MCGIITSISLNKDKFNNVNMVLNQFTKQRLRGLAGFGFVAVDVAGNKIEYVTTKREEDVIERLRQLGNNDLLFFHHRQPTSSPNHVEANHPIKIENWDKLDYKYFLIHNGHITNSDVLKKEHEKGGWKYTTSVNFHWGSKEDDLYEEYTD